MIHHFDFNLKDFFSFLQSTVWKFFVSKLIFEYVFSSLFCHITLIIFGFWNGQILENVIFGIFIQHFISKKKLINQLNSCDTLLFIVLHVLLCLSCTPVWSKSFILCCWLYDPQVFYLSSSSCDRAPDFGVLLVFVPLNAALPNASASQNHWTTLR